MKIFCVGRNYAAHAKELGNEILEEPIIFMKPKSALLQPHTPFYYPEFTNELHYECELVLRISKNGKYIQEKFGMHYTQDESYYILDAEADACVYLGLKENISSKEMIQDLNRAQQEGVSFDAEKYVVKWPA